MADETKVVVRNQPGGWCGALWLMGWLFTIGWLKLTFTKGALALLLWPYYVGVALRH